MMFIEVGKRYRKGPVIVTVKEIRKDVFLHDFDGTFSPMVLCDTPSCDRDVGMSLDDMQDNFEEDV